MKLVKIVILLAVIGCGTEMNKQDPSYGEYDSNTENQDLTLWNVCGQVEALGPSRDRNQLRPRDLCNTQVKVATSISNALDECAPLHNDRQAFERCLESFGIQRPEIDPNEGNSGEPDAVRNPYNHLPLPSRPASPQTGSINQNDPPVASTPMKNSPPILQPTNDWCKRVAMTSDFTPEGYEIFMEKCDMSREQVLRKACEERIRGQRICDGEGCNTEVRMREIDDMVNACVERHQNRTRPPHLILNSSATSFSNADVVADQIWMDPYDWNGSTENGLRDESLPGPAVWAPPSAARIFSGAALPNTNVTPDQYSGSPDCFATTREESSDSCPYYGDYF